MAVVVAVAVAVVVGGGGDEAYACSLGDDGAGGEVRGVPDRAEDAAPVGVFAVEGGFDERGARDGGCYAAGVEVGDCPDNVDVDEFGGAFAVANDELGELLGEGCEGLQEGEAVWGGEGSDGGTAGGTVGEEGDGVVCGCVAVDGDGVEGSVDGVGEQEGKGACGDRGVGRENAEEGGHVRVDHAGAFGHACEGVRGLRGGREGEGTGEEFGKGVGCADGPRRGEPGGVRCGERGVGGGDCGNDFRDG